MEETYIDENSGITGRSNGSPAGDEFIQYLNQLKREAVERARVAEPPLTPRDIIERLQSDLHGFKQLLGYIIHEHLGGSANVDLFDFQAARTGYRVEFVQPMDRLDRRLVVRTSKIEH